jgi:hypothetical protein
MQDAGIHDGDRLVVDRAVEPTDGGPGLMPRLLQRAISPALDSGTLSDPNRYRTRTTLRVAV